MLINAFSILLHRYFRLLDSSETWYKNSGRYQKWKGCVAWFCIRNCKLHETRYRVNGKCLSGFFFSRANWFTYTAYFFQLLFISVKPCQKNKDRKFVSAAPKIVSFSQQPAVKKTPFLVKLKQIFGLSYFVTALVWFSLKIFEVKF